MMNAIVKVICLITLYLLCLSCTGGGRGTDILTEAERLIHTRPDSALTLLDSITAPEKMSDRDYALYCLLITQAKDKNYKKHTTDSIISHAVEYFEKHNDPKHLMTAYYTMGRVNQDLRDAIKAQDYYLKALQAGETTDDYPLLGRICSNLGMLYNYQEAYGEALTKFREAEKYFTKANETPALAYVMRDIGRSFNMLNQPDSSIHYYNKALSYSDSRSKPGILNELGSLYLTTGDTDKAMSLVKEAMSFDENSDFTQIYLAMGKIFALSGQNDSARYYLIKATHSQQLETRASACLVIYQMAREERRWDEFALYNTQFEALHDSLERQTRSEIIQRMQSLYNYRQIEHKAELDKMRFQRNMYIMLLAVFLSLVTLISVFVFNSRRKKKKKLMEEQLFARIKSRPVKNCREQINENKERIEHLRNQISENKANRHIYNMEIRMLETENARFISELKDAALKVKKFIVFRVYSCHCSI